MTKKRNTKLIFINMQNYDFSDYEKSPGKYIYVVMCAEVKKTTAIIAFHTV